MKMRTVGLLGLVLAHLNAPALPLVCAKAYDKVERDFTQIAESYKSDVVTGQGGALASGAAFAFCASKSRSLVSAGACAAVFGLIAIVGYDYAQDAQDAVARLDEYVLINKTYDFAKNGTAVAAADISLFMDKAGFSKVQESAVFARLVELMDQGALCDSQGRPNRTVSEVSELIKSRLP